MKKHAGCKDEVKETVDEEINECKILLRKWDERKIITKRASNSQH